jgi:hypothetical protein
LFLAVSCSIGLADEVMTSFKTSVWEDNNGALTLANMEPGCMTLRSKHYAVKYHWFWSHLAPNSIEVQKIDTNLQKADIFTKGLLTEKFQAIRKLLCGWWSISYFFYVFSRINILYNIRSRGSVEEVESHELYVWRNRLFPWSFGVLWSIPILIYWSTHNYIFRHTIFAICPWYAWQWQAMDPTNRACVDTWIYATAGYVVEE